MNDNDTQPNTETSTTTPPVETPVVVNPREDAMAAIERSNNQRIAQELGLKVDDLLDVTAPSGDIDVDPDDAVADAERQRLERAANAQQQIDRQLQDPAPAQPKPSTEPTVLENFDNLMVKTKVDGQEILRPLAELVRIEQKESAASQRLIQAAKMREEAERLLAQAQQARAVPPTPNTPPADADAAALGKEFLNAIYAGEEEKALQAFQKLYGPGRDNATPDAQTIARQVKQQIDTETALQRFGEQFPEIVADPYLADVADRFLAAELEFGTGFTEALNKAGTTTRDWLRQKTGASVPPPPTPTSRSEKRERKESIDTLPSVSATAASSREPVTQSIPEVLDEMRKARGLVY